MRTHVFLNIWKFRAKCGTITTGQLANVASICNVLFTHRKFRFRFSVNARTCVKFKTKWLPHSNIENLQPYIKQLLAKELSQIYLGKVIFFMRRFGEKSELR